MTIDEHELTGRVKTILEDSANDIDDATKERLLQLRQEALNHIPTEQKTGFWQNKRWPLGIASAASIFIVVGLYWNQPQGNNDLLALDPLEVLTEAEDLEMLEEDVDFYVWLEGEFRLEDVAAEPKA